MASQKKSLGAEHLDHRETKTTAKKTQDCEAAGIFHQTTTGQHCSPVSPAGGLLTSQMFAHNGKHDVIKFKITQFL